MKTSPLLAMLVLAASCALPPQTAAEPANPATASKLSERRKQKSAAESERQALLQKLAELKREIHQTEAAKDSAADTLAASEDAISRANASLRELADEQKATEQTLRRLAQEQQRLSKIVATQQKRLASWLRGQYQAGNEDRLKLLLSGDNPNRINRDLQYMGYLSQAQAKLLEELRQNLAAVEQTRRDTQEARNTLLEIAEEEKAEKALLEQEQQKRRNLHAQLAQRLNKQRKEAGDLAKNEQRLSGLVEKLGKIIEEQRQAEAAAAAAAAEKRRLAALQKLREQQARQAKLAATAKAGEKPEVNARRTPPSRPIETATKAPTVAPDKNIEVQNELVPQGGIQAASFASLRGQLRLPLRGTVANRFGSKRGEGPASKGVFIRATEGEQVRAIASGRVVFAEWLRGFGNLIIVDHGNQYMTIYGNNQTLFKRAGDTVKSGDAIASAGNSGGGEESGLYFEMRHQGRAFDPLGWVNIR